MQSVVANLMERSFDNQKDKIKDYDTYKVKILGRHP